LNRNIIINKIGSLSYYFFASALTVLIGLLINPFMAIGLSHEDYAIIGYYASFGTILAPLLAFSLNSYYARNYFLVNEKKREKMLQSILSIFLIFGLLVSIIFFSIYYLYHKNFVYSIPFSPYAFLSFTPIYFTFFLILYFLYLRIQKKEKKFAVFKIINSILAALLSLLLVYFLKYGAEGRLISILIVAILFCVFSLKVEKFRFGIDKSIAKEAFSFCWPLTISSILTFFFMGIDRTFLAKLNDNYSLGLYNVGIIISGYLGIFGTVLLQTFDPELYKYTSLNQHKKVLVLILSVIGLCLIPNLAFILLSKPIVSLLTFGRYVEAVPYVNILCLKNVTTTFAFIMSGVLIGYGHSRFELINRFLGSFLAIIIYKYFIINWGFYGAAWGQSISWAIMGMISLFCLFLINKKRNVKA